MKIPTKIPIHFMIQNEPYPIELTFININAVFFKERELPFCRFYIRIHFDSSCQYFKEVFVDMEWPGNFDILRYKTYDSILEYEKEAISKIGIRIRYSMKILFREKNLIEMGL